MVITTITHGVIPVSNHYSTHLTIGFPVVTSNKPWNPASQADKVDETLSVLPGAPSSWEGTSHVVVINHY